MHRTQTTGQPAPRRTTPALRARRPDRRSTRQGRLPMNERRQQLISAAIRVFASRGFRGATTREIALAAGVTEAVIFQHFPDKDALYAAILEHKAEQQLANDWMAELHENARTGDAETLLRTLYTGIIRQHERDPDFVRLTMYSALERHPLARQLFADGVRLYECLHEFVRRGQKSGSIRPGRPEVLVRAMLALPIYYVLQRQVFGTPWPAAAPEDLIEIGVTFALAGLMTPRVEVPRTKKQEAV